MIDLDDINAIKRLDKSNIRDSIGGFADQIAQTWDELKKIDTPDDYKEIDNILVAGMGGSSFGGRIIKSLYSQEMEVPFEVISSYHLPAYVNERSFIVAASYSGNTEETITCFEEAYQKRARIVGITCHEGSRLDIFCKSNKIPCLTLDHKYNPSDQPRTGPGYMVTGTIGWLNKLGFVVIEETQIRNTISLLRKNLDLFKIESVTKNNPAKQLSLRYFKKNVVLVGAEFLEGTLYVLRNPIHETGKNFATYFPIPDLNHHLLESLPNPKNNKDSFLYVFFESDFYSEPIRKRIALTKEIVSKNKIEIETVKLKASDKFQQIFEALQLASFTAFYLALLNGVDPSIVPWVTYFQETFRRKK